MKIKQIIKNNKKLLTGIGVIGGLILLGGATHAEELEEALEAYLRDPSLDFLGRGYDNILFANIDGIADELRTMGLQAKCTHKILTQKLNSLVYVGLGGASYAKTVMGAKAFNGLLYKTTKILIKGR